jgi:hypothetical protein
MAPHNAKLAGMPDREDPGRDSRRLLDLERIAMMVSRTWEMVEATTVLFPVFRVNGNQGKCIAHFGRDSASLGVPGNRSL